MIVRFKIRVESSGYRQMPANQSFYSAGGPITRRQLFQVVDMLEPVAAKARKYLMLTGANTVLICVEPPIIFAGLSCGFFWPACRNGGISTVIEGSRSSSRPKEG
jgi:hypothetical protein